MQIHKTIYSWLNERIPLDSITTFLNKPVPKKLGWGYCLGFAVLALIMIQLVTGIVLTMYYAPTPDHAHDSVQYIQSQVMFGRLIRGLHAWGASFIVILVVAHLLHVFFTGGYKNPKQLTWIIGVFMGLVIFGFAFTGYLLPWDQKAYWATMVGTKIAGTIPIIGEIQLKLIRGGENLGALTLTRFFSVHVIILPAVFILLVSLHLFLVRKLGITKHNQPEPIPESEKEPFFPNQALRDLLGASLVIILLIVFALKFPASLEKIADPTDKNYIPRPEWYFLFLFQLLKYFEGKYELIGTMVIPTAGVLILLLLPFLDRNPHRDPKKRPLAIGFACLIFIGLLGLTLQGALSKPPAGQGTPEVALAGAPLTKVEHAGRILYTRLHCSQCHSINGIGGTSAPDLTEVGTRRTAGWMIMHFKAPSAVAPGFKMPPVELSDEELSALSAYLLRLRGLGSAPSPELSFIKNGMKETFTAKEGEKIFQLNRCAACHAIDGIGGTRASDLTLLGTTHDKDWLTKFVNQPNTMVKPTTGHPALNLSIPEKNMLITYLSSLTTRMEKTTLVASAKKGMGNIPKKQNGPHIEVLTLDTTTTELGKKPTTPKELVERGMQIYEILGCEQCHMIGENGGFVGPELTFEGKKRDEQWHYRHFENPRSVSPGSVMPKVKLSDDDMKSLIAYMMSLQ